MSKHLTRDLRQLERNLLVVVSLVEEALRNSITALLERRVDLAEKVIRGDQEIDRREVELEEECLKALALHQPVALDLRFVAACLKIDNDLERIGDLAVNIAERAVSLHALPPITIPPRFRDMVDACVRMLRRSFEAFSQGDPAIARSVCAEDDVVDRLDHEIVAGLLGTMHEDPSRIDQAASLVLVSRDLERVADHATNIAEDVIYLVEGVIVRHQGGSRG